VPRAAVPARSAARRDERAAGAAAAADAGLRRGQGASAPPKASTAGPAAARANGDCPNRNGRHHQERGETEHQRAVAHRARLEELDDREHEQERDRRFAPDQVPYEARTRNAVITAKTTSATTGCGRGGTGPRAVARGEPHAHHDERHAEDGDPQRQVDRAATARRRAGCPASESAAAPTGSTSRRLATRLNSGQVQAVIDVARCGARGRAGWLEQRQRAKHLATVLAPHSGRQALSRERQGVRAVRRARHATPMRPSARGGASRSSVRGNAA